MIINGSCASATTHGQHCSWVDSYQAGKEKKGERRRINVLLDVDPDPPALSLTFIKIVIFRHAFGQLVQAWAGTSRFHFAYSAFDNLK
jgi:hypothetical protein